MQFSNSGYEFLKVYEGYSDTLYVTDTVLKDSTFGWGFYIHSPIVQKVPHIDTCIKNNHIDVPTANAVLEIIVGNLEHEVKGMGFDRTLKIGLSQNQYDAFVCYHYNTGKILNRNNSLRQKILKFADTTEIKTAWLNYGYAEEGVKRGILHRRWDELQIFLSADYSAYCRKSCRKKKRCNVCKEYMP